MDFIGRSILIKPIALLIRPMVVRNVPDGDAKRVAWWSRQQGVPVAPSETIVRPSRASERNATRKPSLLLLCTTTIETWRNVVLRLLSEAAPVFRLIRSIIIERWDDKEFITFLKKKKLYYFHKKHKRQTTSKIFKKDKIY